MKDQRLQALIVSRHVFRQSFKWKTDSRPKATRQQRILTFLLWKPNWRQVSSSYVLDIYAA